MPRHNYSQDIENKIQGYLKEYEPDDLNQTNDLAALRNLATLEVNVERLQRALLNIDIAKEPKQASQIQGAIKDNLQSWNAVQVELNINRKKRKTEGNDYNTNPKLYADFLREQAPKLLDRRLKKLICPTCNVLLGKWAMHVELDSAEPGSIEAEKHPPVPMKRTVRMECWKCRKMIEDSNET